MAIKKRNIGGNQIDGSRILLLNNDSLRALSSGENPEEVPLMKLDSENNLQFLRLPQVATEPTSPSDVANKAYVDLRETSITSAIVAEYSRAWAAEESLAQAIASLSDGIGVGGLQKADNNLGNLYEVSINTDLLPSAAGIRNIGSYEMPFASMRGTGYYLQTGASTATGQILNNPGIPSGAASVGIALQALGTAHAAISSASSDIADTVATGKVLIESGNKTEGTGASGNIELRTGTSSGGSRGVISLSAASVTVNNSRITSVATPTSSTDASTKGYVDGKYNTEYTRAIAAESSLSTRITNETTSRTTAISTVTSLISNETSRATAAEALLLPLDGSKPMTGHLDMATFKINNLADPISDQQAATKYYVDYQIGLATGAGGTIISDNVTEGSENLFFTESRAQAAAVIDSMAGEETAQAPSVNAIKNFIVGGIVVDSMVGTQTDLAPSVSSIKDYIQNSVIVTAGAALEYDSENDRTLNVIVDDSTIYVNSNQLAIKDLGITTDKIDSDAVDGTKLLLANDQPLRASAANGGGSFELFRYDTGNIIQFASVPRLPLYSSPVVGSDVITKSYVDNYFSSLPQVTREIIQVTEQIISDGYVDLQQQVNPSGLVVFTNSRVMLMPSVSGVPGDYTVSVVNGVSRIIFENAIIDGGESPLDTSDILYIMYFPLSGSGKGQESVQAQIETPTNKEYVLMLSAPRTMAIESLVIKTASGSCTAEIWVDGVAVGGMSELSVTTSTLVVQASSGNVVSAGSKVSIIVADNDNVVDLTFSLNIS